MKNITRRRFFKTVGATAIASSALLVACRNRAEQNSVAHTNSQTEDGQMTYRINHNTDDRVSLLGYGMMRLPTIKPNDDNLPEEIDQEMVNREIDYAITHGVNYFDTAPVYCQGLSERSTGIALSRHPRDSYYVATKMSNQSPTLWSREASQELFHTSLRELQVDYIDYLLLHAIGGGEDAIATFNSRFMDNGILDWLVQQKEKGIIRNLGFSYHGDIAVFDMLLRWHDEGRYHWDFVQIELNYLDWEYATKMNPHNTDAIYLYEELKKRDIPAVIMEPLLGGRLANVPDYVAQKMQEREPESSIASWAFRFAGTPEGVLTVLSGMTYMEHLQENIHTYSPLHPLTDEEAHFLEDVARDIYDLKAIPCTGCKYCMPCPYGIDIPGVFAHYNKCLNEGNIIRFEDDNLTHDAHYRRARRAYLVGYDRSVARIRQADHCIGCGQCVSHCPQHINIPRQMRKIDEYTENLKNNL